MTMRICVQRALASLLLVGSLETAVLAQAKTCDDKVREDRQNWGGKPHSWVSNEIHKGFADTAETWCRLFETRNGRDRSFKAVDFGRALFTGEGVHPVIGTIVPGSGLAVGGSLNLARNSASVQYSGSVEARRSVSGFSAVGGQVDIRGSGDTVQNRHTFSNVSAKHYVLPKMPFFGTGNDTRLADQTSFGLRLTTANAQISFLFPKGFSASGQGGWVEGASTGEALLAVRSAHGVVGGGLGWRYPVEERLHGYATNATVSLRQFHDTGGRGQSFRRLDVAWQQNWAPAAGEFSVAIRFAGLSPGGNSVPFYLQPTIGGQDINGDAALRSYRDYRFRDLNALAMRAEYEHALFKSPIGFWAFVDAGQVATRSSDFGSKKVHQSSGIGVTVRAGNAPVFKIYYAWGESEGSRIGTSGNTNVFAPEGTVRGAF
jgi:hypothetical protein